MYIYEFPLWLGSLRAQHSVCDFAHLISGLTPWVGDPALPQTAPGLTEAARTLCGNGIAWQLQLQFNTYSPQVWLKIGKRNRKIHIYSSCIYSLNLLVVGRYVFCRSMALSPRVGIKTHFQFLPLCNIYNTNKHYTEFLQVLQILSEL